MATLAQVTKIMMTLAAACSHAPVLGDERYRVYHHYLADLPIEMLNLAAEQLGSQGSFFPSAGEMRQKAFDLVERASGVPDQFEAWGEVEASFGPYGLYSGAPEWSHPLIGKAIKAIGGYANLCRSENAVADRAQFMRAYDAGLQRHREEVRMLPEVRDALRRIANAERPALDRGTHETQGN